MTVTVSVKGQMVIPAELRRRYGIKPKSKVEFIDTGKEIIMVPLPEENVKKNSYGVLKGVSSSDLISYRREERKREQRKRS
ncbi:MAG TPA: AbrB/MazE/SpoVT family DNA-binding domain-containing protein [Candidatus Omnitrophica bacterium]|nr:AbrB/MazE/SpoVT family DNA-binding domain-containing protein [Candidatus Omnitrophota bacterium]